jgi:hypothetical protein
MLLVLIQIQVRLVIRLTILLSNQNYSLEVTQGTITIIKKFSVIVNPGTVSAMPPAGLVDGINTMLMQLELQWYLMRH